ncbi:PilX N-terminal domain-containing pilus assembly protein [Piscinibacter sp.]|uniref:PilX N-terminal domain-containing pilus assembly protein n=1 Tax=Piscinibacter sp. TaxID=1903157 RepID=UPI002B656CCE|nr:PilX N-terminal domain-containing pilus assembly protein [Albitalea sp.]HUG24038.1 PilX N-terminal domain-containing pilus assembly protein [Albitalea sp.]
MNHSLSRPQRGAATLIVTLVLFFVMTLVTAFANRNHVFAQRASANQYRATQALEAAEAGVEWTIAMLNNPRRVGADCLPAADADRSFRERHLGYDAASGTQTPLTWLDAGEPVPLRAACVRGGTGWDCHCPTEAHPDLDVPAGDGPAMAFIVEFAAGPKPNIVRVVSTGCTRLGGPCLPGGVRTTDAVSRVEVMLGLVPGLAEAPVAPLTVAGSVQAVGASLGLHNPDAASGGVAAHAGGSVQAPNARVTTAPGASADLAWVEGDAHLGGMGADRLFAASFKLDKAVWKEQAAVTHFICEGSCGAELAAIIGDGNVNRLIWVDGDLQLDGPATIGSAERPVIIVAGGALRLAGAVVIHGFVHAAGIEWNDAASGALLRGAAVSESGYQGNAAADLFYDRAVLAALQGNSGSFARVPGSWKDF